MGVRVPPPASRAGVVQMADTPSSEGGSCEFESHLPYLLSASPARVAQTAEAALSKRVSVRVRLPPRASRARVAQAGRGGGLKPRRLRVRVSPRAFRTNEGVYANGQSGLSFKQVPWRLCGFEPRHPCQNAFTLVVAQTAERRAVHAEVTGSTPAGRPFT